LDTPSYAHLNSTYIYHNWLNCHLTTAETNWNDSPFFVLVDCQFTGTEMSSNIYQMLCWRFPHFRSVRICCPLFAVCVLWIQMTANTIKNKLYSCRSILFRNANLNICWYLLRFTVHQVRS